MGLLDYNFSPRLGMCLVPTRAGNAASLIMKSSVSHSWQAKLADVQAKTIILIEFEADDRPW